MGTGSVLKTFTEKRNALTISLNSLLQIQQLSSGKSPTWLKSRSKQGEAIVSSGFHGEGRERILIRYICGFYLCIYTYPSNFIHSKLIFIHSNLNNKHVQ